MDPVLRIQVELSQIMRKKLAIGALIALKNIYFMKKSSKYDREPIQELKSQVCYCVSCQTLVFVKKLTILNLWC